MFIPWLLHPRLLLGQFPWAALPTLSEASWILSVVMADFCSFVVVLPSWIFLHSSTLCTCPTLLVRTHPCYPAQNFTGCRIQSCFRAAIGKGAVWVVFVQGRKIIN